MEGAIEYLKDNNLRKLENNRTYITEELEELRFKLKISKMIQKKYPRFGSMKIVNPQSFEVYIECCEENLKKVNKKIDMVNSIIRMLTSKCPNINSRLSAMIKIPFRTW